MGGLAAIVHWDGAPLETADLKRMVRSSAHRGSDGTRTRVGQQVALAHLAFATISPQPDGQPLVDAARGLWFVFDGRLDNRNELLTALALRDPAIPDAALGMEAFARWGDSTGGRLLGDFAFVAWDARRRRVVCCRDHLGIRHLHYWSSAARFVCATDLAQVLAHPSVPRAPDASTAAEYLSGDIRNGPATLYRDVCRLPPGHILIGEGGRIRLERYWSPEPKRPIRYNRDEDYAAHCRELLTRSVEARMRSNRPVAAMLSGGLDSSSVVCIAHRVVAPGGPRPRPFSMVYPERPEADERPFIDAVARHCGTTAVHVVPGAIAAAELRRQACDWASTPSMPADEMAATLHSAIREHGHRAALTGAGGDFLFTGSVFQYADLLRQRRPVAALRRFVDDWHAGETGRSPLGLLQAGVWPLLPRQARDLLRPIARRVVGIGQQPSWLLLAPEDESFPDAPRGGSYATEDLTRQLGCGMHAFFVECAERAAAHHRIELRHPLLDARLVQFALDIPDDQRKRGRFTKFILREALGDDLPEVVRSRRTKGDFSHAIAEAIEALGGEQFFDALLIAEAGWVDGRAVAAKYRRMRSRYAQGPVAYGAHVPALWMIAAVELWFRSAFAASAV